MSSTGAAIGVFAAHAGFMTSIDPAQLAVRSPADLIAAVPYLLGFHPADSLVVVAMQDKRVTFVARGDLPDPGTPAGPIADHLVAAVRRQDATTTLTLGYGPAERVTPAMDQLRAALNQSGLRVLDALRVTGGRYWSYLCTEPTCCPSEGTPYDTSSSEVSAAAVFAGEVALPDRAALVAQVAPVGGLASVALRQAAERADHRLAELLDRAPTDDLLGSRAIRVAGREAVRAALDPRRGDSPLSDDEVSWLALLLTDLPVRDDAWARTDGVEQHIALWTDVVRRAQPELVAAPASLLAFAAWRAGRGSLAVVALERALAARPDYSLALLLDDMLRNGVPPSLLDGWPQTGGVQPGPRGVRGSGRRGRGSQRRERAVFRPERPSGQPARTPGQRRLHRRPDRSPGLG